MVGVDLLRDKTTLGLELIDFTSRERSTETRAIAGTHVLDADGATVGGIYDKSNRDRASLGTLEVIGISGRLAIVTKVERRQCLILARSQDLKDVEFTATGLPTVAVKVLCRVRDSGVEEPDGRLVAAAVVVLRFVWHGELEQQHASETRQTLCGERG